MADVRVVRCLICGEPCDSREKDFVVKPTKKGLLTILKVAEKRQDDFSKNILPCKDSILSGNTNFKFHMSCRSSYVIRGMLILKWRKKNRPVMVHNQVRVAVCHILEKASNLLKYAKCVYFAKEQEKRKKKNSLPFKQVHNNISFVCGYRLSVSKYIH